MTDETPPSDRSPDPGRAPSRRDLLLAGGTVAAASVITIRPALAQATGSILTCEIAIREPLGPDGKPAKPGKSDKPGTVPPRTFKGEDVRRALQGRVLPGTTSKESDTYMKYIRRLQQGNSGFTCFASLQNPRR